MSPEVIRQAKLLYEHLLHAPGTEHLALALVHAGRPLPSEAAIKWACVRAAERDLARGIRTIALRQPTATHVNSR